MVNAILLSKVNQHLSDIAADEKYKAKVLAVVNKKLGPMLYTSGEDHEIAKDALATVIANVIESVSEGKALKLEELPVEELSLADVQGYVMSGVVNYCDTRARRWSLEPTKKITKDGVTQEIKASSPAARARVPIMSDTDDSEDTDGPHDFWDQLKTTPFNDEERDSETINRILEARGLTAEQLSLVKEKLSGVTFTEMARARGGSEDKYRKIYNRAVQKAGIENL